MVEDGNYDGDHDGSQECLQKIQGGSEEEGLEEAVGKKIISFHFSAPIL